jgi:hypothetical protein
MPEQPTVAAEITKIAAELAPKIAELQLAFGRAGEAMREFVTVFNDWSGRAFGDATVTGIGDPLAPVYGLAQRTYEQTLASIDEALR